MCGIIGYIGNREVVPVLLAGLKRMEYRGYDSSGLSVMGDEGIILKKRIGKIASLEQDLNGEKINGWLGLGHTRWATHGVPSTINAHPHQSRSGELALVHNGIIENYLSLRTELLQKGHKFQTETDTETLLHLIQEYYRGQSLEDAVTEALSRVKGTYGIAVITKNEPDKIVVARLGSPIVLGIGEDENFVASDIAAFIEYTRDVVYLEDGELATLKKNSYKVWNLNKKHLNKPIEKVTFSIEQIEKSGYSHFMLKEIFEKRRYSQTRWIGKI